MEIFNEKIQLGEKKFVDSTTETLNYKIPLSNSLNKITEYDIKKVVNVTDIFNAERQSSNNYQIYGTIDILSMLNGLKWDYKQFSDFFSKSFYNTTDDEIIFKNIFNSFKFYLLKPSSEFNELYNNTYIRELEVIATPDDIDIIDAGFSKNIFFENKYNIIIKKNINLDDLYDGIGLPITDLYLYFEYQPASNGYAKNEEMFKSKTSSEFQYNTFIPSLLSVGDKIELDLIRFNLETFSINILRELHYRIFTYYGTEGTAILSWVYNPFYKIPINVFSNNIKTGNIQSSSYEDRIKIPDYAKELTPSGTTYIWRDIEEKGYIDPLTGIGINVPFLNNKHYIYNNFVLDIKPDLLHSNTLAMLQNMKFTTEPIGSIPLDNLDEFGLPCK